MLYSCTTTHIATVSVRGLNAVSSFSAASVLASFATVYKMGSNSKAGIYAHKSITEHTQRSV